MQKKRFERIKQVLDRRQTDLTILTDEVHKLRNLSAIQRSADAFGIMDINIVEPEKGFRIYRGTAMGTQHWVNVHRHESIQGPLGMFSGQGYQLVGTQLSDKAVDYRSVDYTKPTVLVLGHEREGMSPIALDALDVAIKIDMVGMVQSFNVSVACGIILAEAYRQRAEKGMYERSRMNPALYQTTLFRWLHPKVAAVLDKNNEPYPPLDDDGYILAERSSET